MQVNEQTGLPDFKSEPEEEPDETDIIEEMDQTNTQAGQNGQNLQSGGDATQQTASGFQTGAGPGLNSDNTSSALNQGINTNKLSVGVASANSRTSVAPVENPALNSSGVSVSYIIVPLILLFVVALVLAYKRAREFDEGAQETIPAETELLEEVESEVKKVKKKRKKPKRPHHH